MNKILIEIFFKSVHGYYGQMGCWVSNSGHTVNLGSEIVGAKHVSGKNIFWSTLTAKSRGGTIFEFLHCPFEGRANMHHKIQPNWLTGRCCLAGGSKGQCRKSKIFLSLLLPMKVDQYIFFPETCFASTISEPEFTVCFVDRRRLQMKMSIDVLESISDM